MTSTYQDHDQQHQFYTSKPQACSSSSLSSHVFTYPIQDQGGFYHREVQQLNYQQEANNLASEKPEIKRDHGLKVCLWKKENGSENQNHDQSGSAKWMPSKLRLMCKMMNNSNQRGESEAPTNYSKMKFEDQKQASSHLGTDISSNSSSSTNNIPIRVCSDCKTTKTPLWRSGPRGPKSLCNACGIRQRKARRAMATAAAAANGTVLAVDQTPPLKSTKGQHKEKKRLKNGNVAKYKKRSKLGTNISHGVKKNICFEDFLISLSKNLAFHRVFPQDEKEAAILLMALSCGLVHG